jgi:large subunit ribosomal protein L1
MAVPRAVTVGASKGANEYMPVIVKRSKRYKDAAKKAVTDLLPIDKGIEVLKSFPTTKFDQSVELIFSLGIDAKQADQMIRGSISLPHGVGKTKRVIAFCPDHLVATATAAGAIRAGGQDLVQAIEKENFTDFDVAVATPDMMRFVGRLGKVLGPKGLMPSPKAGTVTPDVASAVREYAAGKIEFRNDTGGNVHSVIGKLSFDAKKLADNINAMVSQIHRLKPQTSKGAYVKKIVLKGSMTPAVYLQDVGH